MTNKTEKTMINKENANELLKLIYNAIDDKLGEDIKVICIDEISSLAEYFIIANGKNPNQVRAIADSVEDATAKNDIPLLHAEGYRGNDWVLLDFGKVIVHVFDAESRTFYNLERIWGDGKTIDVSAL